MKGPGRARLAGERGGRGWGAGWGGVSTRSPVGECGVGGCCTDCLSGLFRRGGFQVASGLGCGGHRGLGRGLWRSLACLRAVGATLEPSWRGAL